MANTTIADIQTEYRGAIDEFVPNDSQEDYIRRMSVTNEVVKFIKPSYEVSNAIHSLGLVVVAKKESSKTEQYSVTRYW